ncbi:MAG: radical SAM protein [Syntrophobacteraceae bacterium]|nr:radical SAM protein [Syntrophobacteraceae bacterium]
MILLINPPLVKPSEPPPGISRLLGTLRAEGVACEAIDANIEGILHLLGKGSPALDRWTLRAGRNCERNLDFIRAPQSRRTLDRYKRAVSDINRLLGKASESAGKARLTLTNYQDGELSPVRSADLLEAAEKYEENPFHDYFSKRISSAVDLFSPGTIGISLNFLSQALTAFSMIGFIKARYGRMRVVVGGSLATSWGAAWPGWKSSFEGLIDRVVSGPGEQALLELSGIDRVARRRFCYGPFVSSRYLSPGLILPYSASCGCWWNQCSFCPEKAEGVRYDPVPPKEAVVEAGELWAAHRPDLIHFVDSAMSPALLSRLAENPPGAPWYGFVRMTRRLADEDFCRALQASGCVMLKLGLESGDQSVLDSECKGMDLGLATKILASLKKSAIGTYVYLLFGSPSESEAQARNTLDFTVRHAPLIDFLNLAVFNMPLNSPDAKRLATSPHYEADLSLYTGFNHPKGWDRAKVRRFLESEFKRHPAIAAVLSNDPPLFTSNHAPFFLR